MLNPKNPNQLEISMFDFFFFFFFLSAFALGVPISLWFHPSKSKCWMMITPEIGLGLFISQWLLVVVTNPNPSV